MHRPGNPDARRRAVVYSPAAIVGGAERYLSLLVPELARAWDVALFCPAARELDGWVMELRRHGVGVYRYDRTHLPRRLLSHARLVRCCRSADVLHLNLIKPPISPLVGVLGWLTGVPLRAGTQHLVLRPEQMTHYRIKRPYLRAVAGLHHRTLHWVISPSAYSTGVLISQFGFPSDRVHTIYHGVDLDDDRFNREPKPRPRPIGGAACWPVLGCVGWVQERKGQYLIVEALPALSELFPQIKVIVVGAGPDVATLSARVHDLGVEKHACFLGHRDDVDAYYRQMDAFILPSRAEGLPIAAIEAMAHRLPVIANDIAPLREVLGDAAVYMSSRSPTAVVDAVGHLFAMDDPQSLGAAARARAETNFRLERMIGETLRLFDACPSSARQVPTR